MSMREPIVMMRAQIPGPSSQTEITSLEVMLVSNVITEDHLPPHAMVNMVPHTITTQMELYCLVPEGAETWTKILFFSVDPTDPMLMGVREFRI